METLKKTIRKKIVETQKQKKSLLNEQVIVTNRLSLIAEGKNLKTKKDLNKFSDELLHEIFYMNSQGFDKKVIQEGLFDFLGGLFGKGKTGVWQYIQERFANWFLTKMGLEDGFLKNAIVIWFANTPFSDMTKMLSDCPLLVRSMSKALIEAYIKKIQDSKLGDSAFYDVLRNAIVEQLEAGKFDDIFYNTLSSVVCPLLNGMMPKMEQIKNAMRGGALSSVTPSA